MDPLGDLWSQGLYAAAQAVPAETPSESGGIILFHILLILFLVLVNGFFSAAEMAVVSLNDNKVKRDAESGDRFAQKILPFIQDPGRFLATIQVGVTFAGFLSSAFAGDKFGNLLYLAIDPAQTRPYLHSLMIILITLFLSYVTLVLGELVPKRIALNNPESVAKFASSFLRFFSFLIKPFTRLLTFSCNLFLKLFRIKPSETANRVTEEEIRMMIDVSSHSGEIHHDESLMLMNVFEFNDKEVSEIMEHRKNIVSLPLNASYDEVLELAKEEGYTRIPVYEDSVDNIVGILNIKDLLYFISKYDRNVFTLKKIMREPLYTPESKHVDALFREMQKKHEAMAIVIDEYGGVAGLITMEDLLEEIVGNIQDEYDDENAEIVRNADGSYTVDGLTPLDDVRDLLPNFVLDEDEIDYDTLAGFVLDQLDRIPEPDEHPTINFAGYTFTVLAMDDKRIARVRIEALKPAETPADAPSENPNVPARAEKVDDGKRLPHAQR